MLRLSDKWATVLASQRETGMGYHVVTVRLKDGRQFAGVTVVGGVISRVAGAESVPFAEEEIDGIEVTHDTVPSRSG